MAHNDMYDYLRYLTDMASDLKRSIGSINIKPFDSSEFRFEYNPNDTITKNKLTPKHVLINGDYTTVVWEDGTSTVVKKASDDQYDFNTAILYAVLKKAAGNNSSALNRYLKIFKDKSVIKKYPRRVPNETN